MVYPLDSGSNPYDLPTWLLQQSSLEPFRLHTVGNHYENQLVVIFLYRESLANYFISSASFFFFFFFFWRGERKKQPTIVMINYDMERMERRRWSKIKSMEILLQKLRGGKSKTCEAHFHSIQRLQHLHTVAITMKISLVSVKKKREFLCGDSQIIFIFFLLSFERRKKETTNYSND